MPTNNIAGTYGPAQALAVTSPAALAAPRRTSRAYLAIYNTGANPLQVGLGAAPGASNGVPVAAGGVWNPTPPPGDAIYLVAVSGNTTAVLVDGQNV